ncbi:unnamed protein product [Cuscuta epithymum]|uniref:Uncharacterized protein n=1 Tax=Cuscuta epithymum TaxID=186058 RepID=A0AAV0GM04_9ASTE|nr:unnamed protein product [Cuscuta epithymum]CAH9148519.1 unnamed protein product [Cuscuta epithymum]
MYLYQFWFFNEITKCAEIR